MGRRRSPSREDDAEGGFGVEQCRTAGHPYRFGHSGGVCRGLDEACHGRLRQPFEDVGAHVARRTDRKCGGMGQGDRKEKEGAPLQRAGRSQGRGHHGRLRIGAPPYGGRCGGTAFHPFQCGFVPLFPAADAGPVSRGMLCASDEPGLPHFG